MGWKHTDQIETLLDLYVEREPMWDGNISSAISLWVLPSLSENQCGMETCETVPFVYGSPLLSENQCGMETGNEHMRLLMRLC